MNRAILSRTGTVITLAILALTNACVDRDLPTAGDFSDVTAPSEAPSLFGGESLKVMTRNMYLGGDVGLVFGAALGGDQNAVAEKATLVWNQIQQTSFPERAQVLAGEIASARPHVVGIQEIPQLVVIDPSTGAVLEVQDHLTSLMSALSGEPYSVVAVQENTSTVLPVFIEGALRYVQYTDRIAVLARDDLPVDPPASGNYAAGYDLGGFVSLLRGWIRISTEIDGVPYHFVNTHLEVQGFAPVQAAQVQELLNGVMAGLDGVTILMGDLNSDAEAEPGAPSWTATYESLKAAGFMDTWATANPGASETGFTCCQVPTLSNQESELDERIDFILLRAGDRDGGDYRIPGSIHVELVGRDTADRTYPSNLWPSDHAGLLASLKVATGIFQNP